MNFTITGPGEYRTRNGERAIAAWLDEETGYHAFWLGCIYKYNGVRSAHWFESGRRNSINLDGEDIIGPWEEPQPVTPPRELVENLVNTIVCLLGHGHTPDQGAQAQRAIAEAEAYLEANP